MKNDWTPLALAFTSLIAVSTLTLMRTKSTRFSRTTSSILLSNHRSFQQWADKQACTTVWRICPQTKAGDTSLDERTMLDRSGRRRHCAAVETAVAVRRRSGWRIRRLCLDEMTMEDIIEEEDCRSGVNVPMTLMMSSTSLYVQISPSSLRGNAYWDGLLMLPSHPVKLRTDAPRTQGPQ